MKFFSLTSLGVFFMMMVSLPLYGADTAPGNLQEAMQQMQGQVLQLQSMVKGLQKTVLAQNEIIEKQSLRLNALESRSGETGQMAQPSSAGPLPLSGISQGFNPEIGLVGTFQAELTEESEDGEGKDTVALKELELSLAQYVDPYSRLDAIIAFNDNLEDQNVDIEEAYYSHWGLPFGFSGRIGKFRAKAGKQNLMHLHQLETADYPLVIQDFFGEEGLSSSGVRLQRDIPNPFDIPLTITGEIFRGNNGDSFSGISRRPVFNTHASSFFEINDDLNLELGSTWMVGDENAAGFAEGDDRYGVHIFGFDATFNWYLTEGRWLKWQSEAFFQQRSDLVSPNHDPWGFYTLFDFKWSRRWSAGVRFDYLEPRGIEDFHGRSTAVSPYLTFWQSEFSDFRLQYRHLDPADPDQKSDDAVLLQANFMIGAHSHPVQ